ncbi:unnamed protein product [Symbiodinium sp. CCMP2456]|nr:unnamed protein product [Symbiodinium sp. CCMP2456]
MSSLDSKAAFKARALELNFPEAVLAKLAAINVDTPTTDEGPLIATLKRALGTPPDDGVLSALAEMRGKVERTDASEPLRMPLAERAQRISALQQRLVGIHWTVDIEPSHKLQDLVAQMVTDQSLVWIPWDRLTSRALELTAEKLDQTVSFDSSGNLKLVKRSADPSCSTTGEYAVKLALQRRSLAFELGRICRYEYLEAWHDQLLQIHMRQQPTGHQRVSLNQLREADKMLWTRIAEDTRGALSLRPDGSYPFEVSLAKWKDHAQVQCYFDASASCASLRSQLAASSRQRPLISRRSWSLLPDPELTEGPSAFASDRVKLYNKLNQMEKELRYEEARLHSTFPDHAREVVKGKNLLLWAQLLKETAFPDEGVFELMKGVDLVGKPDKSPLFDTKEVPAKSTEALLLESASWRRERLKAKDPHKGDMEATIQLWECTLKDRDNGFLKGPFLDEEAVKQHLGVEEFVCSRRFVIEQGAPENLKLRPIDNYKEGGINEAYHSLEKLALFDVNWMTAMATYIARVSDTSSDIEIVLSTGEVLRGKLHQSWKSKKPVWQGRTLDLEKAYRQVPLSSASLKLGVVMVTDPNSGRPCYFVAQSLPFGAASSVFAFNRLSRSILHLSWNLVGMVAGCFYDDFPLLEIQSGAKLASESFEHLLRKIGWKYSTDPDKSHGFEETFDLLGVRLTTRDIANGVVSLQNRTSRVEKMKDAFVRLGLSGKWTIREIQSLQGQVNFALGFASGRALKLLQRALGSFIRDPGARAAEDLRALCSFGIKLLDECRPRVFGCRGPEQPVLIFTDAAYEKGKASYGIVLIDAFTSTRLVGGGNIPDDLVNFWKLDSPEQVIAQAEAYAVVLGRLVMRSFIHGRRVLYFVENEGAREVLVKGASRSRTLLLLGSLFFEMENLDQSLTWLERVASASNVADAPSRGEIRETAAMIGGSVIDLEAESIKLSEECKSTVQIPWKLLK